MSRAMLWMYQLHGHENELGPITASQLKQLATAGTLTPMDKVRPESHQKWSLASNVKGLFPEVVELELEDSSPSGDTTQVDNEAANSDKEVVAESTLVQPIVAQLVSRPEPLSTSAAALKSTVSDAVWKRLIPLQLPLSDELFWIRLSGFRTRRKDPSPKEAEVKNFWQRASEKISSLAETVEIQTNRYLIVSSDGRLWVTNQLAAVGEAWHLPRDQYQLRCVWNGCEATIDITSRESDLEIEFAEFKVDLARIQSDRGYGSPNRVIAAALGGPAGLSEECWTCYPLVTQLKPIRLGSFFTAQNALSRLCIAAITDNALVVGNELKASDYKFTNIIGWRTGEGFISCVYDSGSELQQLWITTVATIRPTDDVTALSLKIAEQRKAAEAAADSDDQPTEPTQAPTTLAVEAPAVVDPFRGTDRRDLPSRSLDSVLQTLRRECANQFCKEQMIVAEFAATPLFGTPKQRLMISCCDGNLEVKVSKENSSGWQTLDSPKIFSLKDHWFVESSGGEIFEIAVDDTSMPILAKFSEDLPSDQSTAEHKPSIILLANSESGSIDWKSAIPYRLKLVDQGIVRFEAPSEDSQVQSFECSTDSVSKRSIVWADGFGIATVMVPGAQSPRQFVATREILVSIWESRELFKLQSRTKGVTLGEMYTQYNQMRSCKFITGIFGNFFLAQQRLELKSPLDSFISDVESAPPGVLPKELEMELIERLSVLEIARHQLNRWFDRCTLMYPHQQADITRSWLTEAFGPEVVSPEDCEREAWRVHQQTRAELRQVQASMSRAMAEVGQNLNAISFAFPEEVRCEALAATRRAASMASKGAMVAAFAGIGGQMLMGLGRASVGDPMGIALLGTVGMSMIGKHLEKNAQEAEKKIRIRAYGIQALQWWKVVLETASVMALESRHTIEEAQKAAMLRDRKLLESMPREKLPQTQKRMAAVMLDMLREEVGNQFYEAIPGSGVFGWHIVDHMMEMTGSQPKVVLKRFSSEVPGSLAIGAKNDR